MNENEAKRKLLIPFENFLNRGIHKENSKIFEDSFFKDVYSQAREAIVIIDESNKNKKQDTAKKNNFEQDLYDVQNVIAFTGRRGTGKTSAMLTFVDNLATGKIDFAAESIKNTGFYPIPYIDASMLEKNEDIFEIVLSKMLLEINKISTFADSRRSVQNEIFINDVREDIVKVYNRYVSLKKQPEFDSASSYSTMEKLAEKHDIRSQIVELVKKYIDCMTRSDSLQSGNGYLVVCIDDIDMSQQNHMDVMQSICQYLMIPGIIVMITSKFSILSASIEQEFHSKVFVSSIQAETALDLCKEQTYDFLRKIIPFDMRISMPSWRKQDYRSLTSIKVNFNDKDNLTQLKKVFPRLENSGLFDETNLINDNYELSPKELIMLMIAHRTKSFLDVAGEKLHFMEPDSLRNLNDLFYLFYNMNDTDLYQNKPEEYYRDLEANRKVLLNYLYFKMIPEFNLSVEEEQTIKEFARDKLHRKGRRIWDYYYKCFTKESEKTRIERLYGAEFYNNEILRNRVEYYSFGEFFRALYFGSRLNLMSKEFIQIILASLSFIMPQFIETEKNHEKIYETEQKDAQKAHKQEPAIAVQRNNDNYKYKPIRDVFRYTLLGTWCDDLFDKRTVDIVVKKNSINNDKDLKFFLYLLMLTPVSTGETINVRETGSWIRISAKLDPTALFMNLVRIKRINDLQFSGLESKYNGPFKNFIPVLLRDSRIKKNDNFKKLVNCLKGDEKLDLSELLFKSPDCNFKDLLQISWFMLKNIDITYNVIKRVVIYLIYLSDNNLRDKKTPKSTPEEAIRSFYLLLEKKLKEEFEVYNKNGLLNWDFNTIFSGNPVIALFLGKTDKDGTGRDTYDVSSKVGKTSPSSIYIDWSDKTGYSELITSDGEVSLNTLLDVCAECCPAETSTLKRLYNSSLDKDISSQDAIKIIASILDNKTGAAVTEISESLKKGGTSA